MLRPLKSPWASLNVHNRHPNPLEIAKALVTSVWCSKWPILPPGQDELTCKDEMGVTEGEFMIDAFPNIIIQEAGANHVRKQE